MVVPSGQVFQSFPPLRPLTGGHQGILFLGKYRTQVTHEHLHAEEEESSYTRLFLSSGWDTYFSSLTNVADIYRTRTKKTETSDSRVRGWFMLDSYLPTFFLTVLYLLSIWLGNKYMKNRHALSLRGILTLYNLGITLLSLYMLAELLLSSWEGGYNLQCQDLTSAGEADVRVAKVLWWYYFSKSIEFLDTIFFVLRKKTSQITFLHVYHHASMFNIWWCVLNWIPCGQSFFGPTLNSFIHILMYSYYGLSVFPSMHKYLWWKKYLTQAQLVQFVLTITHTMSAVVKPCGFPLGCLIFQSSYMLTLVILFLNFYAQTYRKKPVKENMEEPPAGKEVKNGFSKAYVTAANGVINKKAQ
ncbi:elongation of very long chain fatty acids protein 2 isoform X1 [Canis lupus familiaris]|uniref:elongation of very long chain fatty acids protein 2 isoform X1 n=2 Tax=Canis lupus familiaris TaxID=9615 RepID=UPI0015F18AA3|nr:elongation of very long chain fatty acids protein 2 isoform X1 [Canis lupus familiaris]